MMYLEIELVDIICTFTAMVVNLCLDDCLSCDGPLSSSSVRY